MLRILAIAQFDPCGVVIGHRNALKRFAPGEFDFRVALHRSLVPTHDAADYVYERAIVSGGGWMRLERDLMSPEKREELLEFSRVADIIQWHPGIGPGGAHPNAPWVPGVDERMLLGIDWDGHQNPRAQLVEFIHGSAQTWANRWAIREAYQNLATSTLDYASEMSAAYLPPALPYEKSDLAPLREPEDPLVVCHTPTDKRQCSTLEFVPVGVKSGAVVRFAMNRSHREILDIKRNSHACFDHLRGSFSVNTLEAMAHGLVPLVGMKYDHPGLNFPEWSPGSVGVSSIKTITDVEQVIRHLVRSVDATRSAQLAARVWWWSHMRPEVVAKNHLIPFYRGLA